MKQVLPMLSRPTSPKDFDLDSVELSGRKARVLGVVVISGSRFTSVHCFGYSSARR